MKLKNVTLAFIALLATTLSSCSEENEAPVIESEKVKANFTAGIAATTRVKDALWDINDAIGITVLNRQTGDIYEDKHNLRYYTTTAGGNFTPGTSSSIVYFPQDGSEVTFKSYYPFKEGLQEDMRIPISVANQSSLPAIDFMTAAHLSGFAKNDPNVSLRFHHRLTKVIFRLVIGDGVTGLLPEDMNVTIKGMKTAGEYDVLNETLTVDDRSVADLSILMQGTKTERTGIVLPRPAGEGVTFALNSSNGSQFETAMANDLELKSGYKYIFNLTLEGSKVSVSVTIEDWIEGPTTTYDMFGISTPVGESYGAIVGDQMNVYIQNGNDYEDFRTFTYGSDGKWTTPNPAYWDDITHDPINLRAALVPREPAKNDTQLPDMLIANPLSVERNHGAEFIFNHAGSRVSVELQSGLFTATELNNATITLPSYFIGGTEEKGVFIPGTNRGNILVDRSNPADNFAIIQPQSVSPDAALVTVRIGTKDFTARTTSDGFLYEAGVAYKLIVTITDSDVAVSATVIDWADGGNHVFDIVEVTAPAGSTSGIDVGDRMTVYKKGNDDIYAPWTIFTYVGNDRWNPDAEIYWKDVPESSVDLRASLVAAARLNSTQMDDLLIADEITIPVRTSADFTLRHVAAKTTVILLSDVFTPAELNTATITFPQYLYGGTNDNGAFVPGQTKTDVVLFKTETQAENGVFFQLGLIQPQTIAGGENLLKVSLGGTEFWAKAPANGFTYDPGVNYAITIHVNENGVYVSATVIDWTTESIELNAFTIGTILPGASSGVTNGEQMTVYMGNETTRTELATYTYNLAADSWTTTPGVYWEDITGTPTFYASILRAAKLNDTQLDDYLIADPLNPSEGDPLDFVLRHPATKVVIQLRSSDDSFSETELAGMQMTMPNYLMGAEYVDGRFVITDPTATGDIRVEVVNNVASAIFRPQEALAGRTLVNVYNPLTDRTYPVTSETNISFAAGKATTLIIDMKKSAIQVSANVIDWDLANDIPLVAQAIGVSGTLETTAEFFKGKTIYGYILGSNFDSASFTYLESSPGTNSYEWMASKVLYWDDVRGQSLDIAGVYYPGSTIPALSQNVTTFSWNLPRNQTTGYDQYDLLMSKFSVSTPSAVNFDFHHVLSKVRVRLVSDEFTTAELVGANVTLNNVIIKGSASLVTSAATGTNTREPVSMYTDTNGYQYSALTMPQMVDSGTPVVAIELTGYPGQTFLGVLTDDLEFAAGKETVITVTLKKTRVEIAATLEDWTTGSSGGIIIQ